MIIKILGILDIIAAILFWLFGFFYIIPQSVIMIVAFYLLIKGIIFIISLDVASILDIIVSILIFVSLNFTLPKVVIFLIALFLLQKGVLSLL
jgi:hypothetical protein